MFSYRHAFHAGNHADVLKHTALIATLDYLLEKETALTVVDTHAAAGLYRLDGDYAGASGEATQGVMSLLASKGSPGAPAELAAALKRYLDIVVGDFNAVPSDVEAWAPLFAAGLEPALAADAPGTAHDFTGRTDVPRLDHILVSRHWEVHDAGVVTARPRGRLPSDHWPVRAVVALR